MPAITAISNPIITLINALLQGTKPPFIFLVYPEQECPCKGTVCQKKEQELNSGARTRQQTLIWPWL